MDQLIKDNMALVISIADSFCPRNYTEREDLIDAGRIGLWKALQKYESDKGALSTYAWQPIKWAIIKEMKNIRQSNISIDNIAEPHISEHPPFWELLNIKINAEDREILMLRRQGYKFKEICELVSKTHSSVKNRYYKTVKAIKKAHVE